MARALQTSPTTAPGGRPGLVIGLLVPLLAVALLAAGCRDDPDDGNGSTSDTTAPATTSSSTADSTTTSEPDPPTTDDTTPETSDEEIATQVAALVSAAGLADVISYEVASGIVFLSGGTDVGDRAEIDALIASIASLPGVQGVDDEEIVMTAASITSIFSVGEGFGSASSTLTPDVRAVLDGAADELRADPAATALIEGHTDSVGPDALNLRLSQRRADEAKAYLVGLGIDAARIEAVGLGESQPVVANDTAANRAMNRRIEISVTP